MRFSAPEYLLLLVLLAWFWRTGRQRLGFRRTAARCGVGALLIAAASGLQVARGEAPLAIVFALDVSESMAAVRADVHRRVDDLGRRLRPGDRAALVLFGAAPLVERSLGPPAPLPERFAGDVIASGTDIEAALRLARTILPDEGARRIVLFSDGRQTQGDAGREAALLAAAGVAIDIASASDTRQETMVVRRLSAPLAAATGEPFTLTAIIEGPPGARGELVIRRQDAVALRQDIRLTADGSATVTHIVREGDAGVHVYRAAVVTPEDAVFGDEERQMAGAVVSVSGEPRILYVGRQRQQFEQGAARAFELDTRTPAELPRSSAALAAYDAVIVDDVAPGLLDAAQVAALSHHVEHRGSGLLFLGSPRSLDASILPDSEFGRLLPVDLRPRSGVRAPEVALVVVFDKSGSMATRAGGIAKIEFARQGVRRALESMAPTDAVGVIAFDSVPTVVAPLTTSQDSTAIADRLRELEPGGSTAIAPAVRLAQEWLAGPDMRDLSRRHVLLISDGRSTPADAESLRALADGRRFELSVIALGDEHDRRQLTTMAEATGGRAYFLEDAQDLPGLVARESARVAGGRVVEELFVPRLSLHPLAREVGAVTLPPLGGYVVSAPKPGTELVLASHRDDPILATGRHGLGKVALYTADLHSHWSRQLRTAPAFHALFSATVQWLARSVTDRSFYVRFLERGSHVRVMVDVTDADDNYASLLDAQGSVRNPQGAIQRLVLKESLPGRYEADIAVGDVGAYVFALAARSKDAAFDGEVLRGFYWSADTERRGGAADEALLSRLAQATAGRWLSGDEDPFADRAPGFHDVRSWLLAAAFFVFLGELLAPRLTGTRPTHAPGAGLTSDPARHVA